MKPYCANHTRDELRELVYAFQEEPSFEMLSAITRAFSFYATAMEALFEFKDLGYALRSIIRFLNTLEKENSLEKMRTLSVFISAIADDLASWYHHIFILQNIHDIHYLDSSLLSSCMQMEAIFSGEFNDTSGEDLELF